MNDSHVLVVDDDRPLREALGDSLTLEGYRVVCVGDGKAALEHLQGGGRPCLILLDLMMPIMDGKSFRRAMLEDAQVSDIPVVLITAAGAQNTQDVPAAAVLLKPLKIDEVIEVVQKHCGQPCVS